MIQSLNDPMIQSLCLRVSVVKWFFAILKRFRERILSWPLQLSPTLARTSNDL